MTTCLVKTQEGNSKVRVSVGVIESKAPESGIWRRSSLTMDVLEKGRKSCICVTCVPSHLVCAEAFNPDEDEEEKEPLVITALLHTFV